MTSILDAAISFPCRFVESVTKGMFKDILILWVVFWLWSDDFINKSYQFEF